MKNIQNIIMASAITMIMTLFNGCSYVVITDYFYATEDNSIKEGDRMWVDSIDTGNLHLVAKPIILREGYYWEDAAWIGPPLLPFIPRGHPNPHRPFEYTIRISNGFTLFDYTKIRMTMDDGKGYFVDSAFYYNEATKKMERMPDPFFASDCFIELWFSPLLGDQEHFRVNFGQSFPELGTIPELFYRKDSYSLYLPLPIH